MILLIDDVRDLQANVIARSGEVGLSLLRLIPFTELWLDHDLGEGMNGYQVLEQALEDRLVPDKVTLVTSNPVGRRKMRLALESSGYESDLSGLTFTKTETKENISNV